MLFCLHLWLKHSAAAYLSATFQVLINLCLKSHQVMPLTIYYFLPSGDFFAETLPICPKSCLSNWFEQCFPAYCANAHISASNHAYKNPDNASIVENSSSTLSHEVEMCLQFSAGIERAKGASGTENSNIFLSWQDIPPNIQIQHATPILSHTPGDGNRFTLIRVPWKGRR